MYRDRSRSRLPAGARDRVDHPGDSGRHLLGPLGVRPQGPLGHAALAGDLQPTLQRPFRDRARCASHGRGLGASTARSPARSQIGAACPQWSEWACVQTSSRTCSRRRLTCSSARSSCAIEPASCMPVSTSTIPGPAAIAHALPCGTPGHGSGSRSRQSPGRTRSPRGYRASRRALTVGTIFGRARGRARGHRGPPARWTRRLRAIRWPPPPT